MTIEDIHQLIEALGDAPGITELAVTSPDGSAVTVKRRPRETTANEMTVASKSTAMIPATPLDAVVLEVTENAPSTAGITSPLVGIFHTKSPALVSGAAIADGQVVGYVESMKLMNEVVADIQGTLLDVLIDEGQPVEYGQPLFRLSVGA